MMPIVYSDPLASEPPVPPTARPAPRTEGSCDPPRRPVPGILLAVLAGLALACARPPSSPFSPAEFPPVTPERGAIQGGVYDLNTGKRIANALVILQCRCLPGPRETETDARGIYSLDDLPPGTYTIQALYERGNVSKTLVLTAAARATLSFAVDPERPAVRVVLD